MEITVEVDNKENFALKGLKMLLEKYCLGKCCYSPEWWILRNIHFIPPDIASSAWGLPVFPKHLELKHPSVHNSHRLIVRAKVTSPKFIYSLLWWLGRCLWNINIWGFHLVAVSLPSHREQHYHLWVFKNESWIPYEADLECCSQEWSEIINKTFISNSSSVLARSAAECLF